MSENEAYRQMLDRVSHLNSFRELNDILPEVRALLGQQWPPLQPVTRGCAVCGIGADNAPMGYACQRNDCPTRAT